MIVKDAILQLDSLKPNQFDETVKLKWLSDLDGRIKTEIIDTHEGGTDASFDGYSAPDSMTRTLLVPEPYSTIYPLYLQSQVDLYNGELSRYNNSATLFNTAWADFWCWYHRTHLPLQENCLKV